MKNRLVRRFRLSKVNFLLPLIATLVLGGSAFFALGGFNATITNNANTFSSGTIILSETQGVTTCLSSAAQITAANSGTCASDNFGGQANAYPGMAAISTTVTLTNGGSLNASGLLVTPGACTASANVATNPYYGADTSGYCGIIDLTIQNNTVAGSPSCLFPAGAGACPAPSSSNTLASFYTADGTNGLNLGAVSSGASVKLTYTLQMDNAATNADQGLTASMPLTYYLQS